MKHIIKTFCTLALMTQLLTAAEDMEIDEVGVSTALASSAAPSCASAAAVRSNESPGAAPALEERHFNVYLTRKKLIEYFNDIIQLETPLPIDITQNIIFGMAFPCSDSYYWLLRYNSLSDEKRIKADESILKDGIDDLTKRSMLEAMHYVRDVFHIEIGDNAAFHRYLFKLLGIDEGLTFDSLQRGVMESLFKAASDKFNRSYFKAYNALQNMNRATTTNINLAIRNLKVIPRNIIEFENLKVLDLSLNQISDISALTGLVKLTNLSLFNNKIIDISALVGLVKLTLIGLNDNQISDISVLRGLENLEDCAAPR